MKRILITGINSYIGTSFESYLKQWPEQYQIDTVDMIDGSWREKSFAGYDTIFHVAGIAHRKETTKNAQLYYTVNYNLTLETAKKAKKEGVRQFIFLSSMSVYGMDTGIITRDTQPTPKTHYGKSKLQAENALVEMASREFKTTILRPPMVYGKDCKGNFQSIIKIIKRSPFFPACKNERSMIYIKNLCAFVKLMIDEGHQGLFFPQNERYVETQQMAQLIAKAMGKKLHISSLAGWFLCFVLPFLPVAKKAFGTLIYKETEDFQYSYCVYDFNTSVICSI